MPKLKPNFKNKNEFGEVVQWWNLNAAPKKLCAYEHEATDYERWTHTVYYEFDVKIPGTKKAAPRTKTVKGHIHYTPNADGKLEAGPGHFWVKGIPNCEQPTPWNLVHQKRFSECDVVKMAEDGKPEKEEYDRRMGRHLERRRSKSFMPKPSIAGPV